MWQTNHALRLDWGFSTSSRHSNLKNWVINNYYWSNINIKLTKIYIFINFGKVGWTKVFNNGFKNFESSIFFPYIKKLSIRKFWTLIILLISQRLWKFLKFPHKLRINFRKIIKNDKFDKPIMHCALIEALLLVLDTII